MDETMKKRSQKIIMVLGWLIGGLVLLMQGRAEALCLKNCTQVGSSAAFLGPTYNQNLEYRQQSHNFGDNSTNVLGDVNIRVGHEHMEIKGMENTSNTMVDASINSTVILGNMK